MAGVVGYELRCAERKFISLRCRVSSDSGAPAETAAGRRMIFSVGAGPFPHRGRCLAHIANRAPSGRPASHQSSNPLTQAGRIRTSMGREWIQRLQAAPRVAAQVFTALQVLLVHWANFNCARDPRLGPPSHHHNRLDYIEPKRCVEGHRTLIERFL